MYDVCYLRSTTKDEAQRQAAHDMLSLLTPICKGFLTELGIEAAHHGIQIFGGHGYIAEWGMEQNLRDSRISTLYEGTTGIQALDLLGRKVLGSQGELLKPEIGAASVDYLMLSGYTIFAYLWARMADVAQQKLAAGEGDKAFYQAKVHTARFYYQRMLPRVAKVLHLIKTV